MKRPIAGRRRKALIRGGLWFLSLSIVWASGWAFANRSRLVLFPEMPVGFSARELCNCLWVSGQTEAFCREFVYQTLPLDFVRIDHERREVRAGWLGRAGVSRYEGERYGCGAPRF